MAFNSSKIKESNGSTPVIVLGAVVIVVLLGVLLWRIHAHKNVDKISSVSATTTANKTASSSAGTSSSGVITSDPTANTDLSSLNSGISQDNSNLNSSSTAVNDQNYEIAVPSN